MTVMGWADILFVCKLVSKTALKGRTFREYYAFASLFCIYLNSALYIKSSLIFMYWCCFACSPIYCYCTRERIQPDLLTAIKQLTSARTDTSYESPACHLLQIFLLLYWLSVLTLYRMQNIPYYMKSEVHLVWCSLLEIPDPSVKVQLLLDGITYFREKCIAPNPQCLRQWLTFWRVRGFVKRVC